MKVASFYAQLANVTKPSLLTLSDEELEIKVGWHDGAAARLLLWLTECLPETATVADQFEVLDAAKWWAMFFSSVPLDPPADETSNTEKFRTRWRRWLGQKTRRGGSHWVTLLDTTWTHWASGVLDDELLRWQDATRESVKAHWARAINTATIQELYKLDDIYATQRWLSP